MFKMFGVWRGHFVTKIDDITCIIFARPILLLFFRAAVSTENWDNLSKAINRVCYDKYPLKFYGDKFVMEYSNFAIDNWKLQLYLRNEDLPSTTNYISPLINTETSATLSKNNKGINANQLTCNQILWLS